MNARMITVSVALGAALVGGMATAGTASAWEPPALPKPPISTATPTVPAHVHWVKCPRKIRRTGVACFRLSHR
jgi:uncharacterized protein YcfJ